MCHKYYYYNKGRASLISCLAWGWCVLALVPGGLSVPSQVSDELGDVGVHPLLQRLAFLIQLFGYVGDGESRGYGEGTQLTQQGPQSHAATDTTKDTWSMREGIC